MQKPQGGPRDLTPPKLLKADPPNMTRNFSAKEINLEFDEYFKLTNAYQEISISPSQEKLPEYNIKKKTLNIKFTDTLSKNTTYVINFGKAIADVNESNVLKNFTYVFSTGNHIDSLSISGNVINSLTQKKEKDVTVMLLPLSQDTSIFGKKKPSIYTATDTSGNFSLNNLHEGSYKIYALKEASPNKIFDNDNELIAFLKDTIIVDKDISNIRLTLFKQIPEKFRVIEKRFDTEGRINLVFNKQLFNPSIKILYPQGLDKDKLVDFSKSKDSASVYLRNLDFDSLSVAFFDNNKPLDTAYLLKGKNETYKRTLQFLYNLSRDGKLKPNTDLNIIATIPIENYNSSLISLTQDSVPVNDLNIQKDTSSVRGYFLKHRWRANSRYELVLDKGAFTDIYGDKNKKTGIRFVVDKPENYSVLTLKVTVPDTAKNYIVEFLTEQGKTLRSDIITKSGNIIYRNYLTDKYRVRVIYDDNKNGRWDSGNVASQTQPENIWISDKVISLRPNWDAEENLDIPKEANP
ncbi:Ig-like domain-containing protein [Mucilaginibacter segetis]|uniref:Ig-like domain-containing protein n=1 Tax=Mucilaginibacter segetis TaxID=2793071 RepID=A0A934UNJ9_9SPHI|nr:Ig-like domain-containing protein [Mucilaginibacter segetis]MBK0379987.1 Ig-like domain-containing protein [Mucilaginibacter segetis]